MHAKPLLLSFCMLALSLFLPLQSLSAQILNIDLAFPSSMNLEGLLLCPDKAEKHLIRTSSAPEQSDTSAIQISRISLMAGTTGYRWTFKSLKPGKYSLYIRDLGSDDHGKERQWPRSINVRLQGEGMDREFHPRLDSQGDIPRGRIWHVFDLDGTSGKATETNYIFPYIKMIYGYIKDSSGTPGESGVHVRLLNSRGKQSEEMDTDKDGFFALFPDSPGLWTIVAEKSDMISEQRSIPYLEAETPFRMDIPMTRNLAGNQLRIILSWDRYPADLDLHVSGPGAGGSKFHLSAQDERASQGRYSLDASDRDGFGPETVTLNNPDPGLYQVAVQDKSTKNPRMLSASGARISLYRGDRLLKTWTVPPGEGSWWHLGSITENGSIVENGGLDDNPLQ